MDNHFDSRYKLRQARLLDNPPRHQGRPPAEEPPKEEQIRSWLRKPAQGKDTLLCYLEATDREHREPPKRRHTAAAWHAAPQTTGIQDIDVDSFSQLSPSYSKPAP